MLKFPTHIHRKVGLGCPGRKSCHIVKAFFVRTTMVIDHGLAEIVIVSLGQGLTGDSREPCISRLKSCTGIFATPEQLGLAAEFFR